MRNVSPFSLLRRGYIIYNFISPSKNGSQEKKQKYVQYSPNMFNINFSRYQTAQVTVRRTVADPKFLKTTVN